MKRILFVFLIFFPVTLLSVEKPQDELITVGITTVLGTKISSELIFTNSNGKEIALQELLNDQKPLIIVPAYYNCPRLCGLVMDGVADLISEVDLELGKDYRVATVSFSPEEEFDLAKAKKAFFKRKLPKQNISGWNFLVGKEGNISKLMNQLGFKFKKDGKDFSHSAAIFLISPNAKLSQYFTGIQFSPWDLKLALIEASQGGIGSLIDQVVLYCYRFDPTKGKYTPFAFNIMRLGGTITLLFLGGLIIQLMRRDKKR